MNITAYSPAHADDWDLFCKTKEVGTFLHSRRFLSYHNSRFVDESCIIDIDGDCVGLFPAARALYDQSVVVSHPGITYGGLLLSPKIGGENVILIIEKLADYYKNRGFKELVYNPVPIIYQSYPGQDDLYALFRLGGQRIKSQLSAAIDLSNPGKQSSRRKRGLKKAKKANVTIGIGREYASEIWGVIEERLATKYDTQPVHSIEEILVLNELFPENIIFIAGLVDEEVVAGIVIFIVNRVFHAQYIASNDKGYHVGALDYLFSYAIQMAADSGVRYFDFGTSNEEAGMVLNQSLYQFKCEFGAGGIIHETYSLDLVGAEC